MRTAIRILCAYGGECQILILCGMKKPTKKSTKSSVRPKKDRFRLLYEFTEKNLGLISSSILVLGATAEKYDLKVREENQVLLKTIIKKKKITEKDIFDLNQMRTKHPAQFMLFTRSTITSVVSVMDTVFAKILKYYYTTNPTKISDENKTISIKDLESLESVEEAKKFLIQREIDKALLHKGIQERLKVFKEIGLTVPTKSEHLYELNKLIKIRNLIVHNSSQCDTEYEKKYAKKGEKNGDALILDKDYLQEAIAVTLYFCGVLIQSAQVKLLKDDTGKNKHFIHDVAHKLLKDGRYHFLAEMYDSIESLGIDDINKKIIVINYCIGLKKQGKSQAKINKELDRYDWSLVQEETDLQMCLHALRGDDVKFYITLENLIKRKKVDQSDLLDWEIFKLYSGNARFRQIVRKELNV